MTRSSLSIGVVFSPDDLSPSPRPPNGQSWPLGRTRNGRDETRRFLCGMKRIPWAREQYGWRDGWKLRLEGERRRVCFAFCSPVSFFLVVGSRKPRYSAPLSYSRPLFSCLPRFLRLSLSLSLSVTLCLTPWRMGPGDMYPASRPRARIARIDRARGRARQVWDSVPREHGPGGEGRFALGRGAISTSEVAI